MNNGRPPFGNTPAWNQQNQPGYAPQQTGYPQQGMNPQQTGYAPQQTGYAPQQGYPQQTGYAQQPGYAQRPPYAPQPGYPAQGQQPVYGQQGYAQPGMAAPQAGYAQPGMAPQPGMAAPQPGMAAPQQGMASPQQGTAARTAFRQQQAQPQRQTYQQSYPPQYNQAQANPQMYVGYQPNRRRKIPAETIALMVVGGVLPVLFILGLVLPGAAWLKWVVIVLTVAAIGYVWARDAIKGSLKPTVSLIYGALAVVALVSVLTSATPAGGGQNNNVTGGNTQSQGDGGLTGSGEEGGLVWQPTDAPTNAPTEDPSVSESAARQQLESFMYFWQANNHDYMVRLTSPAWQRTLSSGTDPEAALFNLLFNRTPISYEITNISGTEADTSRTASVRATIDKHNGRDPEIYILTILLTKEDGSWYIDPRTLKSNETETATPDGGGGNTTPTQPPLATPTMGMTLYYNPNGGSYYHLDANCSSAAAANLPFKGSFKWEELNNEPYSSLQACNVCGAPLRDQ